jgi:hypothetical protein
MNPIPTTNAMKPAAGKGIPSFPTPVIKDTVIVEVVNAWKGDYIPLEYGAKWDDHPHASQQGSFPDHKLISQAPTSEDGQWVKRIWANDRVDQDTYNYAIKYSGGSDAHPIYIRTYLEPRDAYAPRLDNSPDPLFPGAVLVDEEVTRTEGEFDSRYVQVTRVYETLPGPIIPTKRINERGDLETVNTQVVPPNTAPDPDGLLVTQTQVAQEEVSKGVKTTATVPSHSQLLIKENKDGLLGQTVTTDDIVSPATNPDPLSQTIVASTVQQVSATKAVKRTTTASGPTSLTQKSNDGKLVGNVTVTESVVAPNDNPDAVSASILSSEVRQVDTGKAIKKNTVLNSSPTLTGNQKESGLLGDKVVTETLVAAGTQADPVSTTVISSTVEPIDSARSRKVTVTSVGPKVLTGKQMFTQFGGAVVDTVKESVPANATITPDFRTVQAEISPEDTSKSILQKVELPLNESWPVLTSVQNGPFNERIIVTSQVVPADTPLPANTGSIIYESEAVDRWRSIHTSRSLTNLLSKSFVEYEMASFSFPGLLIIRGRTLANRSNIVYQRPSISGLYRTRIVTEFFAEIPTADETDSTLNFAPVSFTCDAGSFSGVLHNCQLIVVNGSSVLAPQSIPTSLDYEFDGEYLIRSNIVKESIGVYRSVKTYIILK